MNSSKIEGSLGLAPKLKVKSFNSKTVSQVPQLGSNSSGNVSFTGGMGVVSKKGWFLFKNLARQMKDVSEITNAFIAAIGTGIIAPLIIMVSPGKGDKEDKDKKFFQAIRQPLSAGLALLFQLPATILINKGINNLAYKRQIKLFNDDTLGTLIPDKKYLKKQVTAKELALWDSNFDSVVNGKSLKQELEDIIREEYKDVGLDISDEKLARRVAKRKKNFLLDKIVEDKHNKLLDAKVNELSGKNFNIKDLDLLTEDDKIYAIQRHQAAYNTIEKNAGLRWYDKFGRTTGLYKTKRVKVLEEAQKTFAKEKGLELLKQEEPEIFSNAATKLKRFIKNQDINAQKLFKNKKFWLSLFVNLFMVSASCFALNWAHPRFEKLIRKIKNKTSETQPEQTQKPTEELQQTNAAQKQHTVEHINEQQEVEVNDANDK